MDAGTGRVERELADRNAHAVGAEVAEAENALAVGDDDELGAVRPVGEDLGNSAAVIGRDEQAARPLEDQAVFLTGEADRRCVDQRLDLVDVVADHPEEQRLVAIVQRIERDIFLQITGQAAEVDEDALGLRLHRQDTRWEEAAQPKRIALLLGESCPLVEQGITQQRKPARGVGGERRCGHTLRLGQGGVSESFSSLALL